MPDEEQEGYTFFLSSFLHYKVFLSFLCNFQKKNVSLQKISCTRQFESKLSLRSLA